MQKITLTVFKLIALIIVSGCSVIKQPADNVSYDSDQPRKPNRSQSRYASANVETQLLATAQSIEQSLSVLAAAETAERPPILNTEPLVTEEGGMGGLADVDWAGPIGPLVEKVALMTNYRVKILGNEPAIPILISINVKRGVIAEILQNASLQAGKRAHILVFPSSRLIEVRYVS